MFVDDGNTPGDVFGSAFHVSFEGFSEGDEALFEFAVAVGVGHELDFAGDEVEAFAAGEVGGGGGLHGVNAPGIPDVAGELADGFRFLRPDGSGLEARPEVLPGFPADEDAACGSGAATGETAAGEFFVGEAGFSGVDGCGEFVGLVVLHVLFVVEEAGPLGVVVGVFLIDVGGDGFGAGAPGEVEAVAARDDFEPAASALPDVDGRGVRAVLADELVDDAFFVAVDFDLGDFGREAEFFYGDHAEPGLGGEVIGGSVYEDVPEGFRYVFVWRYKGQGTRYNVGRWRGDVLGEVGGGGTVFFRFGVAGLLFDDFGGGGGGVVAADEGAGFGDGLDVLRFDAGRVEDGADAVAEGAEGVGEFLRDGAFVAARVPRMAEADEGGGIIEGGDVVLEEDLYPSGEREGSGIGEEVGEGEFGHGFDGLHVGERAFRRDEFSGGTNSPGWPRARRAFWAS